MPSRGGIKALSSSVQGLNANTRHLASKSEKEMEAAIIEFGPTLMGWPSGVAVAVRSGVWGQPSSGSLGFFKSKFVLSLYWRSRKPALSGPAAVTHNL